MTGCHVPLVLLILELLASDNLLKTQIILSTFHSKVLHLLQLLHKLSGVFYLVLTFLELGSCSDNVGVLLEELLDEVLLSMRVSWPIFIRIVSVVLLA